MELGISLDDEDLGQTRIRDAAPRLTSFNAKVCKPLWFQAECQTADKTISENNSQFLKFNGDLQYHHGNYSTASELYTRSLAVLPSHSQATRLDLRQSLARCYLYMGQFEEAHCISKSLVETAQNIDHKKQSYILKLEVAMATNKWEESESCLRFLIGLQPHYTHFWLQLATVYEHWLPQDVDQSVLLATCFVRARLLLESTLSCVCEVVRRRDEALLDKVTQNLHQLPVSDDDIKEAAEYLRFDLKFERGQNRDQNDADADDADKDSTDTTTVKLPLDDHGDFYTYWCGWAKKRLSRV